MPSEFSNKEIRLLNALYHYFQVYPNSESCNVAGLQAQLIADGHPNDADNFAEVANTCKGLFQDHSALEVVIAPGILANLTFPIPEN